MRVEMILRLLLLSVPALMAGCSHVTLEVPARNADLAVRTRAYADLHVAERRTVAIMHKAVKIEETTASLLLGNGQVVVSPVDLVPAVLPDSQTAQAIARLEKRNQWWNVWGGIAIGTFVGGMTPFILSVALPRWSGTSQLVALYGGLGLSIGGPLISLLVGALMVGSTSEEREHCFNVYDSDLRAFLDLAPPP